ncbi:MAG TPA: flavin reductase family protein [Syntrophomonadaceae bacterium]|nr:flavin reductase family protein [Syntrophomonadaceae bacterium]
MPEDMSYSKMSHQLLQQLPKGAFLTVKAGDKVNTMTIGWGSIGFIWGRPIFMVMVRYSRYTHELIQEAEDFTVSVPLQTNMKKSLAAAGSKTGRGIDKFAACNLSTRSARKVKSPVIDGCELFYECRMVYKQAMECKNLDPSIQSRWYKDGDEHVLYFGEIVACYQQN